MEWLIVLTLLIAGLALMIIEFIFIPGTTVVGIIGFCLLLTGVYFSYSYFGSATGHAITAFALVVVSGGIYYAVKHKVYQRFSLNDSMQGKTKPMYDELLKKGDTGIAISALRPSGEAEFGEKSYEVTTLGEFAATGQKIEIIQLRNNKIFVKPITNA